MDDGPVSDRVLLPPEPELLAARDFERLGIVRFDAEEDEFLADLALREAAGFPEELKTLFVDPKFHYLRIEALIHRPDGSYLLVYRYSRLGAEPGTADEVGGSPFGTPTWGACALGSQGAYHVETWFDRKDIELQRARLLAKHGLDDERVSQERAETLRAKKLDPETVALERAALLTARNLDDESIAERRLALLRAHKLDTESVEQARTALIDEMAWGEEDVARRVRRELAAHGLDDAGVARRREELFRQHRFD